MMKLPHHHHRRQSAETTIAAPASTKKSLQSFDYCWFVDGRRLPHPICCSLFILATYGIAGAW